MLQSCCFVCKWFVYPLYLFYFIPFLSLWDTFKLFYWLIHCTELAKYRIIKIWLFKCLIFQMKNYQNLAYWMFTIWSTKYWICKKLNLYDLALWIDWCYLMTFLSRFSYCSFVSSKSSDAVFCFWESWKATEVNCELWTNREAHSTQISFKFRSFFMFSKWSSYLFVYYLYCVSYLTGSWPMCACVPKLLRRPQMIPNWSTLQ